MKRILVPVDFSDCSRLAVDFAANLCRKTNGEIYLLHVIEIGEVDPALGNTGSWAGASDVITVPYMIERLKMVKKQMLNFISETGLDQLNVHDIIETGEAPACITKAAVKHDAEVIVMGTHGVSGMKEKFIGSVAEKVSQHATCPVLSIKQHRSLNPTRMIFASDFTAEADRVFDRMQSFAAIYQATIHLVKVMVDGKREDKEESRKQLLAFRERHHAENSPIHLLDATSVEEGILLYSKQADFICIGTHGRHGLARFFNGTISGELVNHSFCPVLTINFKEER